MIIQIDHVAFSSLNFEEDCKIFKSLGYKELFIEKNRENLLIKKSMMKQFNKDLDVVLLNSPGNFGIELLNHRSIYPTNSCLNPIFENVPEKLFIPVKKQKINNVTFTKANMEALDLPFFIKINQMNQSFQFNKIIIETENIEKSMDFWKLLSFKTVNHDDNFALLQFNSPLSNDLYQILLKKEKHVKKPFYLDSKGFNCLAFISNSAEKDKELLEKKGIKVTEINKFTLNQKELNIFFAVGPSGMIIEIIGINSDK